MAKKKEEEVQTGEVVGSENERPRERVVYREIYYRDHDDGGIVFGVIVIFVGLTFLLINMGLLPGVIWSVIWRYWPVVFVLAGIHILLGRSPASRLLMAVLTILVIFSIWVKALIDVGSPLVYQWGLNNLPWFESLRQFRLR